MSRQVNDARSVVSTDFLSCIGVFEAQFDYVYHALRRHGISPIDAEDLVQEVFLVMWRRWAEYDTTRPLRPWLAGIAFRVAYNYRQRSGREVPGGIVDAEDESPSRRTASIRTARGPWCCGCWRRCPRSTDP